MLDHDEAKGVSGAQSIERVLTVLELFTPSNVHLSIAEIAAATNLPRSSVHRLLSALRERGYVRQDRPGNRYALGHRIVALNAAYTASHSLSHIALPEMERLRTNVNQTVGLYVRQNDTSRVLLERLFSPHPMQVVMPIGVPMPLDAGAGGRILGMSDDDARRAGAIVTKEERVANACGIAAPIFDHRRRLIAALDVSGPLERFDAATIARCMREVAASAAAISRELGYEAEMA